MRNNHFLEETRDGNLHETRERTSRIAGWEMASANLTEKGQATIKDLNLQNNTKPEVFWIKSANPAIPQILLWKDKVVYVVSVLGTVSAATRKQQKSRLQYAPWKAENTKKIFVIEANEICEPGSGVHGFRFQSWSPTHIVHTNKKTTEALLQLKVATRKEDQNGMAVTLTQDSLVEMLDRRAKYAETALAGLQDKLAKDTSVKAKEYALKAKPIQFMLDFKFNDQAFHFGPLTPKGCAALRSGLKYVEMVRQQELKTDIDALTDDIIRAWPAFCNVTFYYKSLYSTHSLDHYRHSDVFFCF